MTDENGARLGDEVPQWVDRWNQIKETSLMIGLLGGMLLTGLFYLLIPFIVAELMQMVFGLIGRDRTFGYLTTVGLAAVLQVVMTAYIVIDLRAWQHEHGKYRSKEAKS